MNALTLLVHTSHLSSAPHKVFSSFNELVPKVLEGELSRLLRNNYFNKYGSHSEVKEKLKENKSGYSPLGVAEEKFHCE